MERIAGVILPQTRLRLGQRHRIWDLAGSETTGSLEPVHYDSDSECIYPV